MTAALRIPEPVGGYVRMKSGYEKEMALKDSVTDAVPGAVMGELAGFTIPRLGMGTMALAIEGRPDRDTAIRAIHAGLNCRRAISGYRMVVLSAESARYRNPGGSGLWRETGA